MNKAESLSMQTLFEERGWVSAKTAEEADLILINTCSVRISAETRVYGRLAHFSSVKKNMRKNGKKPLTLTVTGCMAERLKDSLKRDIPEVDYVIGTFQKNAFGLLLDACEQNKKVVELEESPVFVFQKDHSEAGSFKAFVPIMHGCNNFCSYCIVPYLRGREISRSPQEILTELLNLEKKKFREVTLLGQNVNSYSYVKDGVEWDFPKLLQFLSSKLDPLGIRWIRFVSSHPKDVSEDLIDVMAKDTRFCRHFHLCIQHGSNRILEKMNRKYTRESYLALVERIRKKIPDMSLTTDLLVGFPSETETDFNDTLLLLDEVKFENAFMYYYNPREGTIAASMEDQIPEEIKKDRLAKIIDYQRAIGHECLETKIGLTGLVLVEGRSKRDTSELIGRTERDEMVVFEGDDSLIGNFVLIELVALNGNTFKGKIVEKV